MNRVTLKNVQTLHWQMYRWCRNREITMHNFIFIFGKNVILRRRITFSWLLFDIFLNHIKLFNLPKFQKRCLLFCIQIKTSSDPFHVQNEVESDSKKDTSIFAMMKIRIELKICLLSLLLSAYQPYERTLILHQHLKSYRESFKFGHVANKPLLWA